MKPPTCKRYLFTVTLSGEGETLEEAWTSCCEAVGVDGLGFDYPPPRTDDSGDGTVLDSEECQICHATLSPGTGTHCEQKPSASWYWDLYSQEYGTDAFGPYNTREEAENGEKQIRAVSQHTRGRIKWYYSDPYQKREEQ